MTEPVKKKEVSQAEVDKASDEAFHATIARVKASLGNVIDPADSEIVAGVAFIYKEADKPPPKDIKVYESLQGMLKDQGETTADGIGIWRLDQIVSYRVGYELLGEHVQELYDAENFCFKVYDGLCYENLCCLVGYPHTYETDADGRLHCATGPAVAWPGQEEFFWHGQAIDAIVIRNPEKVTADYLLDLPAEQRRASYEALGHERAIDILGLNVTHEASINGLSYQLFHSREEAWLKMQSPPLQDGSQPYYLEPVHERVQTCQEALAWRAGCDEDEDGVQYEIET